MATALKKQTKKHFAASGASVQTVRGKLKAWYTRYMPAKRLYRIIVWVVAVLLVTLVAAQLFYPADRGLPFASVAGKPVAFALHDDMAKALADGFEKTKLKLTVSGDKSVEYSLKSAGAEPNTEEMIKRLSGYPLWQRFIPGSIFWQPAQVKTADIYFTHEPLKKFVTARSKELSFPPKNARLSIKDGKLVATDAMAGSTVKSDQLLQAVSTTSIVLGGTTVINVPAQRTKPNLGSEDLAEVRRAAEATLAHSVTIQAAGERFTPGKPEIASWIVLNTAKNGKVTLAIDKEKIKAYLAKVNDKVGKPAGQTNIEIVDGRELSRTGGATGRAIDAQVLADQLAAALLAEPKKVTVTAQFIEIQPSIIFNSKYTTTQAGLQAYINDIARQRNMWISIQQLSGEGWSAQARANESIPSGSTYKLYVSLVLFDKIDKGEIHWDDPMLDTTVAGCFERMTVASTNPCAEKWLAEFGRQYVNDFIYARGFSAGTSFTTGYANQTTANDLNKFMIGLNNGTLLSGANRARLLDSLGRHPYRYGIPTGSAGTVHDKVGFLWDYVHDAAIVQHPRGTYIMTIMTKGQSYAAIAAVTREIERIMYP